MKSLILGLLLAAATGAAASPKAVGTDNKGEAIYLLKDIQPQVYNGTRSIAGEFPAMGWIGNCTGTAVSLNVIFTASHCVANGARINFAHRESGVSYAATCSRHTNYNDRTVANDWALCKLDSPLPAASLLASFKIDAAPAVGTELLVNGFGAPNVGVHYWGKSSVRSYSGQDIVTCGPANLGGGDSGGSLLLWTDDRSGASYFDVVGVNSRGNSSCSWYNRVSDPVFISWARDYETSKGVQLCGISIECKTPPTPPTISLPKEIVAYPGEEILVGTREERGVTYTWSTGDVGATFFSKPTTDAVYTLKASNAAGEVEASVIISVPIPL